jgi:hypothetical protein
MESGLFELPLIDNAKGVEKYGQPYSKINLPMYAEGSAFLIRST